VLSNEHCERARELLDNEFFEHICEEVFKEISMEWSTATSSAERDDLWCEQRLIRRLKSRLTSAANSDAVRQRAMDKLNRRG